MISFFATIRRLALLMGTLAFSVSFSTGVFANAYMQIEDPAGDSGTKPKDEWIEVEGWSFGSVTSPAGMGTREPSDPSVSEVTVVKIMDSTTPKLLKYCSGGHEYPETKLVVRKAGKNQQNYLEIILTAVQFNTCSVSTGGSGGEDRLTENVTLNFRAVKWTYKPLDDKGEGKRDAWNPWNEQGSEEQAATPAQTGATSTTSVRVRALDDRTVVNSSYVGTVQSVRVLAVDGSEKTPEETQVSVDDTGEHITLDAPTGSDITGLVLTGTRGVVEIFTRPRGTSVAMPGLEPYRPPQLTPKPRAAGSQTAAIDPERRGPLDGPSRSVPVPETDIPTVATEDDDPFYTQPSKSQQIPRTEIPDTAIVQSDTEDDDPFYTQPSRSQQIPRTEIPDTAIVQGDPDRPIITGSTPNPSSQPLDESETYYPPAEPQTGASGSVDVSPSTQPDIGTAPPTVEPAPAIPGGQVLWPSDGVLDNTGGQVNETIAALPGLLDLDAGPAGHEVAISGAPADIVVMRADEVAVVGDSIPLDPAGPSVSLTNPSGTTVSADVPGWGYQVFIGQEVTRINTPVTIYIQTMGLSGDDTLHIAFSPGPNQRIEPQSLILPGDAAESPLAIAEFSTAQLGEQLFDVSVTRETAETGDTTRQYRETDLDFQRERAQTGPR